MIRGHGLPRLRPQQPATSTFATPSRSTGSMSCLSATAAVPEHRAASKVLGRMGAFRHGPGAHRSSRQHHHDPQSSRHARRQHLQSAAQPCSRQSIYAADQTINNWFNLAAFSAPANDTWGDLGRESLPAPARLRSIPRSRRSSALRSATPSTCAAPPSTCSTIRSSAIRPAISPSPASGRSPAS